MQWWEKGVVLGGNGGSDRLAHGFSEMQIGHEMLLAKSEQESRSTAAESSCYPILSFGFVSKYI